MVEVALAQVEARCARGGQYHIAGLYHANRSLKDSSQVSDKIEIRNFDIAKVKIESIKSKLKFITVMLGRYLLSKNSR